MRMPDALVTRRATSAVAFFGIIILLTLGCNGDSRSDSPAPAPATRWYTTEQARTGQQVFAEHCATCHGQQAEATANWQTPLPNGTYPPPPLNGTAHAWHHSLDLLLATINSGGVSVGGAMPPFDEVLSMNEKQSAIAYFQSFWSDDIYQLWLTRQ